MGQCLSISAKSLFPITFKSRLLTTIDSEVFLLDCSTFNGTLRLAEIVSSASPKTKIKKKTFRVFLGIPERIV